MALPRLIACDIDGTLIPYGEKELPPGLFGLVGRLMDRGVFFCPASGRQYHSLRRTFSPIADRACFLAENGGVVFGPGREETAPVLSKTVLPREDAVALARDIKALPGCDFLLCGTNTAYVSWPDLARNIWDGLGGNVVRVDDPGEVEEDVVKVSVYVPSLELRGPMAALGPRWGEQYNMVESGPMWIDFTLANKGIGLRHLCEALGIDLADVMAFGDNWNDVPMLEAAGQPYLMSCAAPALKERFPRQCDSVVEVLEGLLQE